MLHTNAAAGGHYGQLPPVHDFSPLWCQYVYHSEIQYARKDALFPPQILPVLNMFAAPILHVNVEKGSGAHGVPQ